MGYLGYRGCHNRLYKETADTDQATYSVLYNFTNEESFSNCVASGEWRVATGDWRLATGEEGVATSFSKQGHDVNQKQV